MQNIEISKLTELSNNPRQISKPKFEQLKKSLKRDPSFLKMRPILAYPQDGQLIVYAGNQRLKAVKELGWTEVPVIIDQEANLEQIRQRILLDNIEFGEWDKDVLANNYELEELKELDLPEIESIIAPIADYSEENAEIKLDDLGNESNLVFKFDHATYLQVLDLIANAKEKLGCDTNEDTLLELLCDYE